MQLKSYLVECLKWTIEIKCNPQFYAVPTEKREAVVTKLKCWGELSL